MCIRDRHGLSEDATVGEFWQLLFDQRHVFLIGGDDDVVFIHDAGKAIEGLLQEGAPDAENVDKLFRLCLLADRPQAASDASRENDAIIMLFVL